MVLPMNRISFSTKWRAIVLLHFVFSSFLGLSQNDRIFNKFAEEIASFYSGYIEYKEYSKYLSETDTSLFFVKIYYYRTKENTNYFLTLIKDSAAVLYYCRLGGFEIYFSNGIFPVRCYREIHNKSRLPYIDMCFLYISETLKYLIKHDGIKQAYKIPSSFNNRDYRYRCDFPDEPEVFITDFTTDFEFDKHSFKIKQIESRATYMNSLMQYTKIDVISEKLYKDLNPDIIDTIQSAFDKFKISCDSSDIQKKIRNDSILKQQLCDSISNLYVNLHKTVVQKEKATLALEENFIRYAPRWNLPLISGDTIYSDSIQSRFILIDFWYIHCHPCMIAMSKLPALDTIFNENIFKTVSINISDKDTPEKIRETIQYHHLKNEVAYNGEQLFRQLSAETGVPQFFIIDTKTNEIIWKQTGYYAKLVEDIEKIIKENL